VRHPHTPTPKISRTKSAGVLLLRVHGRRWSKVAYPHAAAIKLNYHTVWTFVPRLSPDVTRPIDPRSLSGSDVIRGAHASRGLRHVQILRCPSRRVFAVLLGRVRDHGQHKLSSDHKVNWILRRPSP
jgi:hypothetical protein